MDDNDAANQVKKALNNSQVETLAKSQPETAVSEPKLIVDAKQAAERLEKANAENKLLLSQFEKMRAEDILGGKSVMGTKEKELTKEEKIKEEAKAMLKGTGLSIYE